MQFGEKKRKPQQNQHQKNPKIKQNKNNKTNTFSFKILEEKKTTPAFQSALTFSLIKENICKRVPKAQCRLTLQLLSINVFQSCTESRSFFPTNILQQGKMVSPPLGLVFFSSSVTLFSFVLIQHYLPSPVAASVPSIASSLFPHLC